MEFEIDPKKIIDSPYTKDFDDIFLFETSELDDLASDILYGNPTCYLISGYRGVGKSSFIKKLEITIQDTINEKRVDKNVVFVHTSFAKYHDQSYLIRKLIRSLYLQLESTVSFQKSKASGELGTLVKELTVLYQRTFKDISEATTKLNFDERETSVGLTRTSPFEILGFSTLLLLLFFQALGFNLNTIHLFPWVDEFINIGIFIAIILWLLNFNSEFRRYHKDERSLYTKTLYDEEIAGTHFNSLLSSLRSKNYQIVFVLDELDKVEDAEMHSLINEMKPFLVSGLSTFIAVSGQKLFYKFYQDQTTDDSVLSSLFSKVIHIPLSSPAKLRLIFQEKILLGYEKLSESEKVQADTLVNYFILCSRLIPRRFFSLIRQNIRWRGDFAMLDTTIVGEKFSKCGEILASIDNVIETCVMPDGLDRTIRDFMVMKLYLHTAERIDSQKNSRSQIV